MARRKLLPTLKMPPRFAVDNFPPSFSSGVGSSVTHADSLSHVLTPTDQLEGLLSAGGDPLSAALEARRSSTGVLLSPDVVEHLRWAF